MLLKQCEKCLTTGLLYNTNSSKISYCKLCFIKLIEKKFHYTLRKIQIFNQETVQNVLLIYTNNEASLVLYSLLKNIILQPFRKIKFNLSILFLFFDEDLEMIHYKVDLIRKTFEHLQYFSIYFVHIGSVLESNFKLNSYDIFGLKKAKEYNLLFKSIQDCSVRREIIRLVQTVLIVRIARMIHCYKVIISENSETLANISFNAMCFGRGFAICNLAGVLDNRLDDVKLIRPLIDITNAELEIYSQLVDNDFTSTLNNIDFKNLKSIINLCNKDDLNVGGIQNQNDKFITFLQKNGFPATIATILSISSKIEPADTFVIKESKNDKLVNNKNLYNNNFNKVVFENLHQKNNCLFCKACFDKFNPDKIYKNKVNNKILLIYCKSCAILFKELQKKTDELTFSKITEIFEKN